MDPLKVVAQETDGAPEDDASVVDGAAEQAKGTATAPNWESPENPFYQQYHGLKGNFQQTLTENRTLKAQLRQHEIELAKLNAVREGKTAEEAEMVGRTIEARHAQQDTEAAVAEQRNQILPFARAMVLEAIAKEHNIDPAEIADAPSPEVAEFLARRLAKLGRTEKLQDRRERGVDRAEGAGAGSGGIDTSALSPRAKIALGLKRAR